MKGKPERIIGTLRISTSSALCLPLIIVVSITLGISFFKESQVPLCSFGVFRLSDYAAHISRILLICSPIWAVLVSIFSMSVCVMEFQVAPMTWEIRLNNIKICQTSQMFCQSNSLKVRRLRLPAAVGDVHTFWLHPPIWSPNKSPCIMHRNNPISSQKNLVWHSHNPLLLYITVEEYFIVVIPFIFNLYFLCFVVDELPAFIIVVFNFRIFPECRCIHRIPSKKWFSSCSRQIYGN